VFQIFEGSSDGWTDYTVEIQPSTVQVDHLLHAKTVDDLNFSAKNNMSILEFHINNILWSIGYGRQSCNLKISTSLKNNGIITGGRAI
jgi:hypothetical protein